MATVLVSRTTASKVDLVVLVTVGVTDVITLSAAAKKRISYAP